MATKNELLLQEAYQKVIDGDSTTENLNKYHDLIKVVDEERGKKALEELNSIKISNSFRPYYNNTINELQKAIESNNSDKIDLLRRFKFR